MSQELEYRSASSGGGVRTAAWICLLVLGVVYLLMGLVCGGGGILMMIRLMGRGVYPGIVLLIFGAFLVYLLGTGGGYVWTALLIRKNSRRAARVAQVLTIINASLIGALVLLAAILALSDGAVDIRPFIFGMLFYGLGIVANGVVAFLLTKTLREWNVR